MFSKIIDTFRVNNSMVGRSGNTSNINMERRSSPDEGDGNDNTNNNTTTTANNLSKPRSTGSIPIIFDPITSTTSATTTTAPATTSASAIGIRNSDTANDTLTADTVVYPDGRRRSSLFGYSTNAADDYMQKDLLSSSWS